ncbi:MAG: hypothetical protein IPK17_39470 [Chloroflexi bacterium]|uniref:hypothetical protein n=1 Tax=Candidatus Flexifilum breve TaxID=3140694 RepID=UPI003135596D|nr:hypothetical protein [Chloroflexota bacterium]
MGVDEDDAHIYAEGIRRGGTLVSLTTNDEWAERAETIMNRYHWSILIRARRCGAKVVGQISTTLRRPTTPSRSRRERRYRLPRL